MKEKLRDVKGLEATLAQFNARDEGEKSGMGATGDMSDDSTPAACALACCRAS